MGTAKNLNRKIKPSEDLLKVIEYNYVWEEYYTLYAGLEAEGSDKITSVFIEFYEE